MNGILRTLLAPLQRRLMLLVSRAVVRAVSDAESIQRLRVSMLRGEAPRDGVEHFQEYGFACRPHPSSGSEGPEGIFLSVGGDRSHGVVIAVGDRRYRLRNLAAGEVALYDDQGAKVHLSRSGIVVDGGGRQVTITDAPTVRIEADLHVTGNVTADGDVSDLSGTAQSMAAMRATFNAHKHSSGGNEPLPPLM